MERNDLNIRSLCTHVYFAQIFFYKFQLNLLFDKYSFKQDWLVLFLLISWIFNDLSNTLKDSKCGDNNLRHGYHHCACHRPSW